MARDRSRRRARAAAAAAVAAPSGPLTKRRVRDRRAGRECGWCGTWVPYNGRGRPALYCSRPCRQRAFEIRHAALDAAPATPRREVIERTITEVRDPAPPQRAREWEALLGELVAQLSDDDALRGRPFDHPRIYAALTRALAALDAAHPGGLRRLAR